MLIYRTIEERISAAEAIEPLIGKLEGTKICSLKCEDKTNYYSYWYQLYMLVTITCFFGTHLGQLLADQMDDAACRAYATMPDRLYIVHHGRVVYQGGLGPFGYQVHPKIVFLLI